MKYSCQNIHFVGNLERKCSSLIIGIISGCLILNSQYHTLIPVKILQLTNCSPTLILEGQ